MRRSSHRGRPRCLRGWSIARMGASCSHRWSSTRRIDERPCAGMDGPDVESDACMLGRIPRNLPYCYPKNGDFSVLQTSYLHAMRTRLKAWPRESSSYRHSVAYRTCCTHAAACSIDSCSHMVVCVPSENVRQEAGSVNAWCKATPSASLTADGSRWTGVRASSWRSEALPTMYRSFRRIPEWGRARPHAG